ncbi:hypothetical protein Glove_248g38 [Diversispora epigaea]|uniref:Uncharacterized protein n=1 Tax=Diversispora epigaea TaxID=1348612 RepID=A0A397I897_9GLOM|nr:hypothetical protein Glove_248g38 [Diversispora epigaea]
MVIKCYNAILNQSTMVQWFEVVVNIYVSKIDFRFLSNSFTSSNLKYSKKKESRHDVVDNTFKSNTINIIDYNKELNKRVNYQEEFLPLHIVDNIFKKDTTIDYNEELDNDFVKKGLKNEFDNMMKYESLIPNIDNSINNSDIKELIINIVKIAWGPVNSIEHENNFLNENLSKRIYHKVFLTPIINEISLFTLVEDYNLIKSNEEDCSNG